MLQDFIRTDYLFIKLVVQYGRGAKERKYFKDMLAPHVQAIVNDESIDLETDPVVVSASNEYRILADASDRYTKRPSRTKRCGPVSQVLDPEMSTEDMRWAMM